MENASKALIIAGTILIAMIVLSTGVYLSSRYVQVGESYEETQDNTELSKFNSRFIAFQNRNNITAQEIVSLANYVDNYNQKNEPDIIITCTGLGKDKIKFIKDNSINNSSGEMIYFSCTGINAIKYDENTGKVSSIAFTK